MPNARPWRTMRSSSTDARLRDLVVLDEEFLELVDHQQRARHRLRAARALVAGDVLHAELAEQIAAALQFVIHALQHAQAEFAVALDGHDARVRQALGGVALELDAFLEVDEVKLDLLRAAPQREVGDDDVEQRGFAGTGLAGDERVLARAFADGEVLQLGRAGAADGHAQFVGGVLASRSPRPAGATCANGTSTRLESRLLRPTLWMNSVASSGAGGASSSQARSRERLAGERRIRCPGTLTQTLLLRSSSGTKSCGSGWRWSQ